MKSEFSLVVPSSAAETFGARTMAVCEHEPLLVPDGQPAFAWSCGAPFNDTDIRILICRHCHLLYAEHK